MVAILQPHIPHYREDFFKGLQQRQACDIFCYEDSENARNENFHTARINIAGLKKIEIKGLLIYNPLPLLRSRYKVLVLMLHFGHLTTWLLLLTKIFHRKKIILWGHGISVKRYLEESRKPSRLLKYMIRLTDTVWVYTQEEQALWKRVFPEKRIESLNNTISGLEKVLKETGADKDAIKAKHGIAQNRILIFCARFNTPHRRIDILLEVIERLDSGKFGFIIIGDGRLKPDFSKYKNVYDFGGLYDPVIKAELFQAADIYFQPGWIGLSVVEGMAYRIPVFTMKRQESVLQCVEFAYIREGFNGLLFDEVNSLVRAIENIPDTDLCRMGGNARTYVNDSLTMDHMVDVAVLTLKQLQ
ncbi:MAG: glycosyltransferase [Chitinophagaceae bacterium]|jgi:hypothetical protein|nr:MAG: glycosyltransferase [Chitinophagaceae bacterium]